MHSDSGHTTSVWMGTTEVPQFQPLTQDLRTNVCVIGAGIAGMTTAYLLARASGLTARARYAIVVGGLAVWLIPLIYGITLAWGPLGPKALN